jgi:hypothetical protein
LDANNFCQLKTKNILTVTKVLETDKYFGEGGNFNSRWSFYIIYQVISSSLLRPAMFGCGLRREVANLTLHLIQNWVHLKTTLRNPSF